MGLRFQSQDTQLERTPGLMCFVSFASHCIFIGKCRIYSSFCLAIKHFGLHWHSFYTRSGLSWGSPMLIQSHRLYLLQNENVLPWLLKSLPKGLVFEDLFTSCPCYFTAGQFPTANKKLCPTELHMNKKFQCINTTVSQHNYFTKIFRTLQLWHDAQFKSNGLSWAENYHIALSCMIHLLTGSW